MAEIETGRETRQGPLGKPVLYVLIAALVLAGIYLVGTGIWSVSTAPTDPASQSTEAARETAKDPTTPATTPPATQQPKPQ